MTLADARALPDIGKKGGGLSVVGMGLSPEATVAKLKDQTEQARQLNRMKETGLSEPDLAKVDARRARDSEIFQLTQNDVSQGQAAGAIFQRDAALARQTAESPTQIAVGQQALATGEQGLQRQQQLTSMLTQLGQLDPAKDPGGTQQSALIAAILAAQGKAPQQAKSLGYGAAQEPILDSEGFPTGATRSRTYSKDTGQYTDQGGGAQGGATAQVPPEHVKMLQDDPAMAAQFEEIYGPGSAAQYLKK